MKELKRDLLRTKYTRVLVEEDACADDAEQENAGQTKAVAEEHAAENLVTEGF